MTRFQAIVIGAGPGGICSGIRLRESGCDDFVILEKASGLGGTWYHNRYPGAACDVPSHLYSFSFATRLDWPRPYSPQPEILTYLQDVAERHDLARHLRFDTEVRRAEWIEERALWRVQTANGEALEAPVLLSAMGMFNELHVPEIPGLEEFAGTRFHSARWPQGHDLIGERVGVIGSAASAVQLVPKVARDATQLDLYQRTANWVLPKDDTPYRQDELDAFRDDPSQADEVRRKIYGDVELLLTYDDEASLAAADRAGREALLVVENPETRRALEPQHPYGCKRPLLSNDYYPTFNRDNVALITDPIDHVTAEGVVTRNGRLRAVDTLILATGFDTTRFLSAIEVIGRDGIRLEERWRDGAYAFLGSMIPGFPNLFMMYGPNTNNGSIIEMIEHQVDFAMRQIERLGAEDLATIEPSPQATTSYNEHLQSEIDSVEVWQADCFGYYRGPTGRIVTQWPHNMGAYERQMRDAPASAFVVSPRRA